MTATSGLDAVRERFATFAEGLETTTPLYSRLARVAHDVPWIAELLLAAPELQRLPVLLFASVHWLLLADPAHPLAGWYADLTDDPRPDDPATAFTDFCRIHADAIRELVATRTTQTNEVGRCALVLPSLAAVAAETGPLALVDVGASGGLNLRFDLYGYRYGDRAHLQPRATVQLACEVRGPVPLPAGPPPVAWRVGLDRDPVDVSDADQARWLQACVWPDERMRFQRLTAAIEAVRAAPVRIDRGDAVDDLPPLLDEAREHGHPVVLHSWVLNYLPVERRRDFAASLAAMGRDHDLTWVYAESPSQVEGLPRPDDELRQAPTVVSVVRWRDGEADVSHPADAHPHGRWLHWQ